MKIPTTVLLSAVLVITSLTTMAMPTFNANITNFPLDDEGNLRVAEMSGDETEPSWEVINILEGFNLTWTPSLDAKWVYSEKIDIGSVDVAGYSRMKLYIRVSDYTRLYQGSPNQAYVSCFMTSLYQYGEAYRRNVQVQWYWDTGVQSLFIEYPRYEVMMELVEPSFGIVLQGMSYTPNGPVLPAISCLVSIGIYLRNE